MENTRCCGSGNCLIDVHGRCWCGQQWDGEKMCDPNQSLHSADNKTSIDDALAADDVEENAS